MIYLDTNVIISYVDELDSNHEVAVKLLEGIKDERVVSELTLVELSSVYSRAGLPHPQALALYSVRKVGAKIIEIDFNYVLRMSLKFSELLKLKTLDLLHVIACKIVGAKVFATFDKDIRSRSELISRLGIEIIP